MQVGYALTAKPPSLTASLDVGGWVSIHVLQRGEARGPKRMVWENVVGFEPKTLRTGIDILQSHDDSYRIKSLLQLCYRPALGSDFQVPSSNVISPRLHHYCVLCIPKPNCSPNSEGIRCNDTKKATVSNTPAHNDKPPPLPPSRSKTPPSPSGSTPTDPRQTTTSPTSPQSRHANA